MRINANSIITGENVIDAINEARGTYGQDIYLEELTTGKRGAINFYCNSAHGKYTTGRNGDHGRAASWTAWGYVIARLFIVDPDAHIGTYRGVDNFMTQILRTQEMYYNRRLIGIKERDGEPGQDCMFVTLLFPDHGCYDGSDPLTVPEDWTL